MKCLQCKIEKLSKEFPQDNISESCDHPSSCCLRCMIKHFKAQLDCPYTGCENKVANGSTIWKQFQIELDQLYPPVEALDVKEAVTQTTAVINVTTLAGDMASFPCSPQMTIEDLKEEISKRMNVETDKQQLMYKDVMLDSYKNQEEMKLGDYKLPHLATVHLMILMYAIPKDFNHVIFDLSWDYPSDKKDYLDASCLIFSGKSHVSTVDYVDKTYSNKAIWHSGDAMDDSRRVGHHAIEVFLKDIPPNVTHLYFTLSAFESPTIARFPNPTLKFYQASNKQKDLCKTTFTHVCDSQAVILCSVRRAADGIHWEIFESGQPSAGNAFNYTSLIQTIEELP